MNNKRKFDIDHKYKYWFYIFHLIIRNIYIYIVVTIKHFRYSIDIYCSHRLSNLLLIVFDEIIIYKLYNIDKWKVLKYENLKMPASYNKS